MTDIESGKFANTLYLLSVILPGRSRWVILIFLRLGRTASTCRELEEALDLDHKVCYRHLHAMFKMGYVQRKDGDAGWVWELSARGQRILTQALGETA